MRLAAFLRGINVGARRVKGTELCAVFASLGLRDVASLLASGNVVFDAGDDVALEARIEAALEESLGYPVEAFVRSAEEVSHVVSRQPFPAEAVAASDGRVQVTFLRRVPPPEAVTAVMEYATDQDRLAVVGREWYWLPSGGISRSPLDVRAIEGAVGRGTTRTLGTVMRLRAKLLPDPAT